MPNEVESERRRFPRIRSDLVLQWKKISHDDFFARGYEGVTKNISGGGVCFDCSSRLANGDMVALNLVLEEFPAAILALGRVVRNSEKEEGSYEIAVEFWWVGWDDETAQRAIGNYIRGKLE